MLDLVALIRMVLPPSVPTSTAIMRSHGDAPTAKAAVGSPSVLLANDLSWGGALNKNASRERVLNTNGSRASADLQAPRHALRGEALQVTATRNCHVGHGSFIERGVHSSHFASCRALSAGQTERTTILFFLFFVGGGSPSLTTPTTEFEEGYATPKGLWG